MRRIAVLIASLGLTASAGTSCAQDVGAQSLSVKLERQLAAARPGETIRLAKGDYGTVRFPQRTFRPALTVDARAARFSGLVLHKLQGIRIVGGTISGPRGRSYGVNIRFASDVRMEGMTVTNAHRGIVVQDSADIALVRNTLTDLISDGINVALSRRVLIDGNSCRDFSPTPAVYAPDGTLIRDGDHPDCIQAWSRPTAPPTSDLAIVNNVAEGRMQGIFLGNHVRAGVDDGGFDRVVIRNNRVVVGFGNGVRGDALRDSIVTDNQVLTMAGAVLRPGTAKQRAVRANLLVTGERIVVCNNTVPAVPDGPGTVACPTGRARD